MRRAGLLLCAVLLAGLAMPAAAQTSPSDILTGFRPRNGGVLGLMGFNMTPDGSANALQFNRTEAQDSASLVTMGQFGFGFTVSQSFPLYLEAFGGYARYDPRYIMTNGEQSRRTSLRWNNVTGTLGVGYDIQIAQNLYIRPIINGALGYAAPDSTLFGWFVERRTGIDTSVLTDRHANVYGLGGSLVLAYYDHLPAREIDLELRYTNLQLQTFGDTFRGVQTSSNAQTLYLWARYRWPTGWEAFGRPMRWVTDFNASWYFGDQQAALGFGWAVKVGGGIEFDIGRYEIGAMGINLNRVRLVARYMYGDHNVTGNSVSLGVSF